MESVLTACELELESPERRESFVQALARSGSPALLVLNTCQRLECFGRTIPAALDGARVVLTRTDAEAFERLVRIAAGLESRILGEMEVLGQVREAYRVFCVAGGQGDAVLDKVFQDALALAREARRRSGIDRAQTSLASLAGRELLRRVEPGVHLAVVGSGTLAGSVARFLAKRGESPVRIAGRCPAHAIKLAQMVGGFGTGLDQLMHLFDGVGGIVTATAAPHAVVYAHHLKHARRPLAIVDLGVPPDCAEDVRSMDGVAYIGLQAIEARASTNLEERQRRAAMAVQLIREGVRAWSSAA